MNKVFVPLALIALILFGFASGALYQVDETEQVIVTQFGQPVGAPIVTPGLKFKIPFIQTVRRFEKRVLEWDGSPDQIPTLDKRFILLDTTARWRIKDPLRFLQSVGDERSAQSRLDDLLDSAARDVVSSHLLIQVVRNFSRELPEQERHETVTPASAGVIQDTAGTAAVLEAKPEAAVPSAEEQQLKPEERLGRDRLTDLMVKRARENLPNLGIELVDVRIRRINYVQEVEKRVYERMISERQRIAAQFRSEGDGASAKIQGEKERALDTIQSEAYRQAQEIIGKADAEAARIYAEAYGQAPEFYAFFRTLEAYKQTVKQNSTLLLTTDSAFYRFFNDMQGLGNHRDPEKASSSPRPLPPPLTSPRTEQSNPPERQFMEGRSGAAPASQDGGAALGYVPSTAMPGTR